MNLLLRLLAILLIFGGIFTIVFSVLTGICSLGTYPWITISILLFGAGNIILGTWLWKRIFRKTHKPFDPVTGKIIAVILVSYGIYSLFTRLLLIALDSTFTQYLLISMIPGCVMEAICIALGVWIWKNIPTQEKG